MKKGGPYWHVIRFLDHPLLPANTPRDFPKIVKHGISDDGPMHPKSPHVSGPDGAVTLMYRMGKEDWLKKILDLEGTREFELIMRNEPFQDLYIKRYGCNVEIGFLSAGYAPTPVPAAGIRYHVQPSGEWKPISTSDMGQPWGGTEVWVRAQGEFTAKAFWYHKRWAGKSVLSINWTGMTGREREDNIAWCQTFEETNKRSSGKTTSEESGDMISTLQKIMDELKRECRGGCGKKNCKLVCGACKDTCYCSQECQKEDWKYHKSVCGVDPY